MVNCRPRRHKGFTLIELIVVMAIVALLISIATPNYVQSLDRTRDAVLAENLKSTRRVIEMFRQDTGRYPSNLKELVDRNYLAALPIDPITERDDTWILVAPPRSEPGLVRDIKSGANGTDARGGAYREY